MCHIIGFIKEKIDGNYSGWATFSTFYRLFKENKDLKMYGARFESDTSYINVENQFMFNGIVVLFDPISFTLVKFFCWWKYLQNFYSKGSLLKSYDKVESEKILDKLTQ